MFLVFWFSCRELDNKINISLIHGQRHFMLSLFWLLDCVKPSGSQLYSDLYAAMGGERSLSLPNIFGYLGSRSP